jgi:hypothetical protein
MISLRRRQAIIAGLGTLIAPAVLSAPRLYSSHGGTPRLDASEERLVLSGRVLGLDGKALASATVMVGEDRVATDADGRFVLVTTTRRAERPLYRVSRDGHAAEGVVSNQRRDTDGTWRATFGLMLA